MTHHPYGPNAHNPAGALDHESPDRDTLLTRIIDAEASPADWAAFRALAAHEPAVWSELAEMQRQHDELSGALAVAIAIADQVEIPVHEHHTVRPAVRVRGAMAWGGWLAAAAVLLAFTLGMPHPGPMGPGAGTQSAGFVSGSAEEAFQRYLDLGKRTGAVVGQAPDLIVLDSTPLAGDEGYEVVYLRQLIERRTVKDLYRLATDDAGNPVRVPVPASSVLPQGTKAY